MEAYNTIAESVKIIQQVAERKEATHKEATHKDKTNLNRLIAKVDNSYLKKKHAMVAWTNMMNAFEKENFGKALNHSKKVMTQIHPVANDSPFAVKDKVSVIRYEHGWMDGRIEAVIKTRHKNAEGVWSYTAQVTRIENEEYNDKDYIIEIRHTRDAHLAY